MLQNLLNPVVLFFVLGIIAGLLNSDLRLPDAIYEVITLYLLIAIGLKGGVQMSKVASLNLIGPVCGALVLGITIPLIAYVVLRRVGKLGRYDAAALAAHYGSVSAVTFAVVQSFLERNNVSYEGFTTFLLVLLEIPAIAVAILLARLGDTDKKPNWSKLLHEVFLNKSIYLLLGGVVIGTFADPNGIKAINYLFVDLFQGILAFFLLEMGLVATRRLGDLRKIGGFLIVFAIAMPLFSSVLGVTMARLTGMSLGGAVIMGTLAASASYIAAPAAMRMAVPEANPTLYLTASLGITFPFNLTFGIPLYYALAQLIFQ